MTVNIHVSIRKFHHQLRARYNVKHLMSNIEMCYVCVCVYKYTDTNMHTYVYICIYIYI